MKVQADKHMHFAGTSSAEAFQLYIYIAWNLKTLSYSVKKCHNISKDTIWYHKLSKPYLNVSLTNIFWKHFSKIIAILWTWTSERFKLITAHFRHILTNAFLKKTFFAIPWKWTTECIETDWGHNLWIEIRFENIELLLSTYAQFWNFNVLHKNFSCLPTINMTFLIFSLFPRCVSP